MAWRSWMMTYGTPFRKRDLLSCQVVLLIHTLSVREEAAGEPVLQEAVGVREEGVGPSSLRQIKEAGDWGG